MKIGRYRILDEIGHGAMGTVYRAQDPLIERTVAIKTVPLDQLRQDGGESESRFLREAQSAGRLSHPNIVTIYDVGETDNTAYIAMEYLPGLSLRELMDKGPMPLDLALETALQMAEALAFAHEHGVIHRDIKPANVVIAGRRGRIKLTDFGIAHLTSHDQTQDGQMLGSPRYMSPEQAMGREVDGRSDIFSLGALLYEMLTARYAFDGDSLPVILYRVINDKPLSPDILRPELPANLVALLDRMLKKQPRHRPDARTLVGLLHNALAGEPAEPVVPPPTPNPAIPRILPALAFLTPLAVLLLIAVGIILITHFLNPVAVPNAGQTRVKPTTQPALPLPANNAHRQNSPTATQADLARSTDSLSPQARAYLKGLDKKRTTLELQRTELLLRYTRLHPDVVAIDRQLEQLKKERRAYLRRQR